MASCANSEPGDVPGDGPHGTVVFARVGPSGERLYEVDVAGGSVQPLGGDQSGRGPRLSPDGRSLVYSRSTSADSAIDDVHVLDMGRAAERSLGPGACPTWTRDGRDLIVSRRDGLYLVDLDGVGERLNLDDALCGVQVNADTYLLWSQDEALESVTRGVRRVLVEAPGCGIGPVDVDPAGERIAYTIACDEKDPYRGLWVMDLSSEAATRIVDDTAYGASWSPDGEWIATTIGVTTAGGGLQYDLRVVRTTGDEARTLVEGGVGQPTWGPLP